MEDVGDTSSASGIGDISHFDAHLGEKSSDVDAICHQGIAERV